MRRVGYCECGGWLVFASQLLARGSSEMKDVVWCTACHRVIPLQRAMTCTSRFRGRPWGLGPEGANFTQNPS